MATNKNTNSTIIVLARKNGYIHVYKAEEKKVIQVWTKNGNLESEEEILPGQLLVTRSDKIGHPVVDSNGHTNSWRIDIEVLRKKYDFDEDTLDRDGDVVAVPKGGVQVFKKLTEDTVFMKPWGEGGALVEQKILAGGWANITDLSDVYGIAAEEFSETYEIIDPMEAVEVVKLTSIRYYKGYMPIGILTNSRGVEVGYLSPFRAYSFQVSSTFEGQGCEGASQVFGLNNLLDGRLGTERNLGYQSNLRMDTVKVYLLEQAAMDAIRSFCRTSWQLAKEYGVDSARYIFESTPCEKYLWYNEKNPEKSEAMPYLMGTTMMQRFIGLCVKWLSPSLYAAWSERMDIDKDVAKNIAYHKDEIKKNPEKADWHNRRIEEIQKDFEELKSMSKEVNINEESI